MAATLAVGLVTPIDKVVQGSAEQVVAPATCGQVTILPEHAPLLTHLLPGVVELRGAGAPQRFYVSGGFLEVAKNRVTILAEAAEPVAKIDLAAARSDLQAAEQRLQKLAPNDEGYAPAARQAEGARAKVAAAS